jgi:hypothetical protein
MGLLKLTIDRQNKALVGPPQGSITNLPPLFQSNVPTLQISVVDPINSLGSYSLVDLNGYSMRVAVGPDPTGAAGGPAVLALQDTFVWNAAGKYFQGDLPLNTAAIDTYIGALDQRQAWLEVNVTGPSGRDTILQLGNLVLKAVVDELASVAPNPVDQYFTKSEVLALFALKLGKPGDRILFVSADGTATRELGVNNDKSAIDNLS